MLPDLLARFGPPFLFLLAILETSFVTGLVVPSGMMAALAMAVADQTGAPILPIVIATVSGGFVGDVLGYGIGRRAGESLREGQGWASRTLRRYEATAGRILGGHPVYSVTVARLVSFARSLMPLNAGMSRIPFPTYLLLEIPGLLGWAALYLSIGLLAGRSWAVVSSLVGTGWLVLFCAVGAVYWWRGGRSSGPVAPASGESP